MEQENKEISPEKSPYFWIRLHRGVLKKDRICVVDRNFLVEVKARIMTDLLNAAQKVWSTIEKPLFVCVMYDSANNLVVNQRPVIKELKKRQTQFAKTAGPEDWEHREMALELESISDRTCSPSPTPEDLERREKSEFLAVLIERARNILAKTPTTSSFQEYLIDKLTMAYKFGVSADRLFGLTAIGLDLDRNQFDLFNPQKTEGIERRAYAYQQIIITRVVSPEARNKLSEHSALWEREFEKRYGKKIMQS